MLDVRTVNSPASRLLPTKCECVPHVRAFLPPLAFCANCDRFTSVFPRAFLSIASLAFLSAGSPLVHADPLSKHTDIDFFRDAPSRDLRGLAARSDGRLVSGPTFTDLAGDSPADLLWSLAPTADPAKWLVGTGPDGKIFELTLDSAQKHFTTRELAKLDESHIFALARLADGSVLAGTSPRGALCLVRDGKQVARVALPVDSIFDLLVLPDAQPARALVATGNPGRVYLVDLAKFAQAGVAAEKITDAKALADHGITLFGEIRDRNVRRLARLSDGRIAAGSAPKGNVYVFAGPADSAPLPHAPVILQENRDAEVTDLLASPDGSFYATITFSGGSGEGRITPGKGGKDSSDTSSLLTFGSDRFGGRSNLVWFPAASFPEILASRGSTAFYRLARRGDLLLLAGGEQGELLGYDIGQRLSLTFAGSSSSQLNGLAPIAGQDGRFLVLRNNAPGFALVDFSHHAARRAETRRIDLGLASQLGAIRFNRLRDVPDNQLMVELKTSNGSDDLEGWSDWTPLHSNDGGWFAPELRGRFVKLRLSLAPEASGSLQIDKASLYSLPQNRRPSLQDFRFLSANFALIPTPEPMPAATISLGQILNPGNKDDDSKQKGAFLGSQVVPSPGMQIVLWTVNDPDDDNLDYTFSIRRDGDEKWTDVALHSRDSYVQFDTSYLPDGLYFTHLTATETDPRPAADRLTTVFETDDLAIDHTPADIVSASAQRQGQRLIVTIRGRDALSLVQGVEVILNNGAREQTEQPIDGIRDSREETFVVEFPLDRAATATSAEVVLYDAVGNTRAQRVTLP